MKVPLWEQRRPVSAWLPAEYTREYIADAGSYRFGRPEIEHDLCNLCGLCWVFCPEGAISREGKISVDLEDCRGCGICAFECPRGAIELR